MIMYTKAYWNHYTEVTILMFVFRFQNVLLFLALASIDGTYSQISNDECEFVQQYGVLAAAGELPGRDVWSVGRCVSR